MQKDFYFKKGESNIPDITDKVTKFINDSKNNEFVVSVKEANSIRSLKQNKWYWGILIPAFMRLGFDDTDGKPVMYDKDYWHEKVLAPKFLTNKIRETVMLPYCSECVLFYEDILKRDCVKCGSHLTMKGIDIEHDRVKSTTVLTVDEFKEYLEKCKNLLADAGGYLTTMEYSEYEDIYA